MRRARVGSTAEVSDEYGRPIIVTVVRHGRDAAGCYTEVRNALGRIERYHPAAVQEWPRAAAPRPGDTGGEA